METETKNTFDVDPLRLVWLTFLRWLWAGTSSLSVRRSVMLKLYHVCQDLRHNHYICFTLSLKWFDSIERAFYHYTNERTNGDTPAVLFPGIEFHGSSARSHFLTRTAEFQRCISNSLGLFGEQWGIPMRGPAWKEEELTKVGPLTFTLTCRGKVKTDTAEYTVLAWQAPGVESALIFFLASLAYQKEIDFIVSVPSWPTGPRPLFLCKCNTVIGSSQWIQETEKITPGTILDFVLKWLPGPADHPLAVILVDRIRDESNDNLQDILHQTLTRWFAL